MRGVDFNFSEYPTLLALVQDPSFMRVVVGPAGSAKTSGLVAYTLYLAMQQKPGNDKVRRVRTAILRQTYQQLVKATVTTLRTILGGVATITDGKPPTGFARLPLPDGTTLEWELMFFALDSANARDDALGMECTNMLVDEISSVTDEELLQLFMSRIGRYPSLTYGDRNDFIATCLAATNGPKENHFLADYNSGKHKEKFDAIAEQIGRPYFKLFQQPPALVLQADGTYAPNPAAENVKNLPGGYGYYFAQLNNSADHIEAYVMGRFVPLSTGQVVYRNFRHNLHVVQQAKFMAQWGKKGRIGLSFDFGRTPVCLVWVDRPGGGIVIVDEFMAEDVSIDGLWANVVRPGLMERYPACIAGREGFTTGDPAGADETQATDQSPYSVLTGHGLNIEFPGDGRKDRLEPRIEAVRQRLSRLDAITGEPMLQITDNCTFLISALMTTYVYQEIKGAKGSFSDVPVKHHRFWCSDLANAVEYLCLYRRGELEPAMPVGAKRAAPPLLGG